MISFVIPLHNKESVICTTLKSIKTNADFEFEVVVVDDCSTDNSANVAREYLRNHIKLHQLIQLEKNYGRSNARNVGIANAKGDFIYLLDADDTILPGISIIKECSRAEYVYTFNYLRKSNTQRILKDFYGNYDLLFMYSFGIYLPTSSSIMFSKVNKDLIRFSQELHEGEDIYCWLKVNRTKKFFHVNTYTMMYNDMVDYNKITSIDKPLFLKYISKLGFDENIYGHTLWITKKLTISSPIEKLGLIILEKLLRVLLTTKRIIPHLILRIILLIKLILRKDII
jgi:teichuronic acid biosynthesis glycosyltransferase TuaG